MEPSMRWTVVLVLVAGLTTATAGCRTPPRKDLVEAELRVKDQDLRELRSELERTDAYNQYLQRELRNIQQAYPNSPPPETLSAAVVRAIVLGRQTGGIDDDNFPGDEALQVVIEPRDGDNHTVKAPGTAHVQALEVTTEGLKRPIAAWHVNPETLRKSWRAGLLSTGYYLVLPWNTPPTSTKVRVVVQFVGQDDRMFEADRDVLVRLIPPGMRKPAVGEEALPPAPPAEQPPAGPRDGPVLPAPKESEPLKKDDPTLPQPPTPALPPVMPPATALDPERPLKGMVELLKPVAKDD
jgi:hypothetical protein